VFLDSALPVQYAVLPGRTVEVQRRDVNATCGGEAWEWSALSRDGITDAVATVGEVEQEKAVTGGNKPEVLEVVEPEDGAAALEERQSTFGTGCCAAVECDERERRLATMMGAEEVMSGGEAVPEAADRAAAKDFLRRKADEDLPHHDILRQFEGDGGGHTAAARPFRPA
jgi:hypothetical protein